MNNAAVQNHLKQIESYIASSIEQYYAPLTVAKFVSYDSNDKGDELSGVIIANNGMSYGFHIDRTDGLPMLKPVA